MTEPNENRRSFIGRFIGGIAGLFALAFAGLAGAFLSPPPQKNKTSNILTGSNGQPIASADIPADGSVTGRLLGQPVIVVRHPSGLRALSAVCTHAGCLVSWNSGDQSFHCPCHGAKFDASGAVIRHPATRPLKSYPIEVNSDGEIEAVSRNGSGGVHAA